MDSIVSSKFIHIILLSVIPLETSIRGRRLILYLSPRGGADLDWIGQWSCEIGPFELDPPRGRRACRTGSGRKQSAGVGRSLSMALVVLVTVAIAVYYP